MLVGSYKITCERQFISHLSDSEKSSNMSHAILIPAEITDIPNVSAKTRPISKPRIKPKDRQILKNIRAKIKDDYLEENTVLPIMNASASHHHFELAHRPLKAADGKFQCARCPNQYPNGAALKSHFLQIHLGFRYWVERI